jgi:site-specific recombinase XerD
MNVESFLLHCDAKRLSRKTIRSYEQTLKLFASYLERELKVTDVDKVKPLHIRIYIKYLRRLHGMNHPERVRRIPVSAKRKLSEVIF